MNILQTIIGDGATAYIIIVVALFGIMYACNKFTDHR